MTVFGVHFVESHKGCHTRAVGPIGNDLLYLGPQPDVIRVTHAF